jgi:hypothetical protein
MCSYKATFQYAAGVTPCNVPLSAISTARLVVDNPGDAALPEPQTTVATIVFTGCKQASEARVGRVVPTANSSTTWGLSKTVNVTSLKLKPGQSAGIKYQVTPSKKSPTFVHYFVSGTVLVSPAGGVMGAKPLPIKSVAVKLSSGNSGPATCVAPGPDGSTACRFDQIKYGIPTTAPDAGTVTGVVTLADGSVLTTPAQPFDFTQMELLDSAPGARATLSDGYEQSSLDAAKAADLKVQLDDAQKPPSTRFDVPLIITDARTYTYTARITAGKKCGSFTLKNVAKLTPVGGGQKALTAADELVVVVEGCRR